MPLQKQVLRLGDLTHVPRKHDLVTVEYVGWVYESQNASKNYRGRQFDSSSARGAPIQVPFGIGATIKGWEEALSQMSVGEKTVWTMTPDLAYGIGGLGRLIEPNATLIFEIELVAICREACHFADERGQ